jgi:hypothetical protein
MILQSEVSFVTQSSSRRPLGHKQRRRTGSSELYNFPMIVQNLNGT